MYQSYYAFAEPQIEINDGSKYVTATPNRVNIFRDYLFDGFEKLHSEFPNFPLVNSKVVYEESSLSEDEKNRFVNLSKTCNYDESFAHLMFLNCVFVCLGYNNAAIEILLSLMHRFGSLDQFIKYHEFLLCFKTTQTLLDELIFGLSTTEVIIIYGLFNFEKEFIYRLKCSYQLVASASTSANNAEAEMDVDDLIQVQTGPIPEQVDQLDTSANNASEVEMDTDIDHTGWEIPINLMDIEQPTILTPTPTTSTSTLTPSLPRSFAPPTQVDQTVVVCDGVGSKKKKKKSAKKSKYPKRTITPAFYNDTLKQLVEFSDPVLGQQVRFSDQLLTSASNPNNDHGSYIVSGNLTIFNNYILTVQRELPTDKFADIYFKYNLSSVQRVRFFRFDFEFVCEDGTVDTNFERFQFLKENIKSVERGTWCFSHSIKRLDAEQKSFSIRVTVNYNGVQQESASTPFIDFANTTTHFSQPSGVKLGGIIVPFVHRNQSNYNSDEVAVNFYGFNDVFKGLSKKNSSMPLEVLFERLSDNDQVLSSYLVHHNIGKTDKDDHWRFNEFSDESGKIIRFLFSNVVNFSMIIPKGRYNVTFRYHLNDKPVTVIQNIVIG